MSETKLFKKDATGWVQIYTDKINSDGSPPKSYDSYWREYDIENGLKIETKSFERKNEKGVTVTDDRLELHCKKHRSNASPRIMFFKTALGTTKWPHLHGHGDKGNKNLENRKDEDCCIGLDFRKLPNDTVYPEDERIKKLALNESREEKIWMRKLKEETVKLLYRETKKEDGVFSKTKGNLKSIAQNFLSVAEKEAVEEITKDAIKNKKLKEEDIEKLSNLKLKKKIKNEFPQEFEEKSLEKYMKKSRVYPVTWDSEIDEHMTDEMVEKERNKLTEDIKQIKGDKPNEKLSVDESTEIKNLGKQLSALDRTFYAERKLYHKDFRKPEEIPEEEKNDEHYISGYKYNPAIIYKPTLVRDEKTGQMSFPLKRVDIKPGEYGKEIVTPNSIVQLNLIARPMMSRDSYGLGISLVSTMLWYRAEKRDIGNEVLSAPSHTTNFYIKQEMVKKSTQKSNGDEEDDMEKDLEGFYNGESDGKDVEIPKKKRPVKVTIPDNIEDEEDEPPKKRLTRNMRRR